MRADTDIEWSTPGTVQPPTAVRQYAYFESLERMVRIGLSLYLTIFLLGTITNLIGLDSIFALVEGIHHLVTLTVVTCLFVLLYNLFYGVSNLHWLGEMHTRLDERWFGYLRKSNDIIFRRLVNALEPEEQKSVVHIQPRAKGALARSIFSHLANDEELFGKLFLSSIFRYWIWYWIAIYGTFVFTSLTAESFVSVLLAADTLAKTLFTTYWLFALCHLGLTLHIGARLVEMTQRTVDTIVHSHRQEIATMLRTNIVKFQTSI